MTNKRKVSIKNLVIMNSWHLKPEHYEKVMGSKPHSQWGNAFEEHYRCAQDHFNESDFKRVGYLFFDAGWLGSLALLCYTGADSELVVVRGDHHLRFFNDQGKLLYQGTLKEMNAELLLRHPRHFVIIEKN